MDNIDNMDNMNNMNNMNIELLNFDCKLSNNSIRYKCYKVEKEAHIEYNNIDLNMYKPYFVLLRSSIDTLKGKGYNKIVQLVMETEWESYLKGDKWKIRKELYVNDDKCYIIECAIDNALENISNGLGMV